MDKMLNQKQKFVKECERAILEQVSEKLEVAIALKDAGKHEEADAVVNDMKNWLEEKVEKELELQVKKSEGTYDRTVLPANGEIIVDGDNIEIAVIGLDEREKYLSVSYEYSVMKHAFEEEKFKDDLWNDFISDTSFVCSIYEKISGEYIGYCSVKDLLKNDWELAIELLPDKCNKGYGSEALKKFMCKVHELTGKRFFRARVELDNHASQHLMKKLGGIPDGIGEFLLHGDEITKFQENYKHLITDEIRAVAEEFCMEAEDMLGYVLEYRFDMEK